MQHAVYLITQHLGAVPRKHLKECSVALQIPQSSKQPKMSVFQGYGPCCTAMLFQRGPKQKPPLINAKWNKMKSYIPRIQRWGAFHNIRSTASILRYFNKGIEGNAVTGREQGDSCKRERCKKLSAMRSHVLLETKRASGEESKPLFKQALESVSSWIPLFGNNQYFSRLQKHVLPTLFLNPS